MILIKDKETRRQLRDFFSTTITYVIKIRLQLEQFSESQRVATGLSEPTLSKPHIDRANEHLAEAHRFCEKLASFTLKQEPLQGTLNATSVGSRLLGRGR